jgi:Fe-S cluster assembly protein SufD
MATVTPIKTAAETQLAESFGTLRDSLPGAGTFASLRAKAMADFSETGLPHRRVEAWKYTDLRAAMREAKPLAGAPTAADLKHAATAGAAFAGLGARRLVFVNGSFAASLSDLTNLEPGLSIVPMSQALASSDALLRERLGRLQPDGTDAAIALNTAFMSDGALIRVADGARIGRPLHLVYAQAGPATASYTRSLIVAGARSKLTVVKSFEGEDGTDYQTNTALEVFAGDEADLEIVRLQAEGDRALHLATLMIEMGARTKVHTMALNIGAALARHQVFVTVRGDHAEARISGANLLRDRQHADATLVVTHDAPHGTSRETFKSVVEGEAEGVFQGKIVVKAHAQKTDGRMGSHALLLSEHATMNNKPELEIFADDVQCAHGATCGELDEELLFYLKARGIPHREAQSLLIQSFVGEAIDTVDHEGMREVLGGLVETWLAGRA